MVVENLKSIEFIVIKSIDNNKQWHLKAGIAGIGATGEY